MLINIMYHHANKEVFSNTLEMLEAHFAYIKAHFTCVLPGENVTKTSVCLTFDDGYCDFYFLVYPLLKKYQLKALLAFSSAYLIPNSSLLPEERMAFSHQEAHANYKQGTFCTIEEMKEMIASGHIMIASHAHSHTNLCLPNTDMELEIKTSKMLLEEALGIEVSSFVFPFGKYNAAILEETQKHYRFIFRIGNALQSDFSGIRGLNYRINGDGMQTPHALFCFKNLTLFWLKGFFKKVLG